MIEHSHNNDQPTRVTIVGTTTSGAQFMADLNYGVCTVCYPSLPNYNQAAQLVGESLNSLGGLSLRRFRGDECRDTYIQTHHVETFTIVEVRILDEKKGGH